ncbi:MAG TPA: hypothetical protein VM100_04160, partial [Longimicrobiales bacterium]|nr:hypothetical protein [Longimicrobiales bacterium]
LDGGAAWRDSLTTLTFDVSYMPIWTSTWAEAGTGVTNASGKPIPVGAPTIENEFVFSNTNLHFGWLRRFGNVEGQAGLNALHINYSLEQYDHIRERARSSNEGWTEWSLFWGMNAKVGNVSLRYFGSHQGGLEFGSRAVEVFAIPAAHGPDVVAAPSASLSNTMGMDPTKVTSHQFMVSIPFGRR